jgi:hypothetical protein
MKKNRDMAGGGEPSGACVMAFKTLRAGPIEKVFTGGAGAMPMELKTREWPD